MKAIFSHGAALLYHADCLDWLRLRRKQTIHGVVTDPPYGLVEYSEHQLSRRDGRTQGVWRVPPAFDGYRRNPVPRFTTLTDADREALLRFFQGWAEALYPTLVPGAHVVVATNPLVSFIVADALHRRGFERRGQIIRLVQTMRGGDRPKNADKEFTDVSVMPRSMWEPWLLFRKPIEGTVHENLRRWGTGGLRRISDTKPFGDVIRSRPTLPAERAIAPHPSVKPQAFLRQVVRAVLPLGTGVVLDPFAGSGSTLAACEAMGVRSIGVEMNEDYCGMAISAIPKLAANPAPN